MRRVMSFILWAFFAACGIAAICGIAAFVYSVATIGIIATQPESSKTVAAFEVPLRSDADRDQFLMILRVAAEPEGMHVDAESAEDLAQGARVSPAFAMTMHVAVWRGANDDEAVTTALDQPDHLGQVWIMFSKGKEPESTSRFRENVMHDIMLRWPNTLSLPIMPTGAIPTYGDLIRTPNGYIVNPSEAHKYETRAGEKRPH